MFAAFPAWYATMFSGLYLALLLILVALIARGVSFEFREQGHARRAGSGCGRGRRRWAAARSRCCSGSASAAWSPGCPIDADGEYAGGVADMFTAYGVWTGLTLLALSVLHGATFLALKTEGAGARALARGRPALLPGRDRRVARVRRVVARRC